MKAHLLIESIHNLKRDDSPECSERLPLPEEIGLGELDGRDAVKNFHGKTLAQAEALFDEAPLSYAQDLMWMEPVGFRFYVRAGIRYCLSDRSARNEIDRALVDWEIVAGLRSAILFQLDCHPSELIPCARLLADFCAAVLQRWDSFSKLNDPELRVAYEEMAKVFADMCNESGDVRYSSHAT